MRKMLTFALVGGALGAGLGYARSSQSEAEGSNDVATTAAGGAALGLGVGLILDRRAAKKARKRVSIGSALAAGGIVEAARAALPVIEHAAGVARKAAEAAKPAVEKAADSAKDRARDATHRVAERARSIDLSDGRVREAIAILN